MVTSAAFTAGMVELYTVFFTIDSTLMVYIISLNFCVEAIDEIFDRCMKTIASSSFSMHSAGSRLLPMPLAFLVGEGRHLNYTGWLISA